MKLAPQSRDILRQYKAARWQASGPEGACQPARKTGQAAPAGEKLRRPSGAAHSPLRCQSLLPGKARIIRDIFL